MCVYGVEAGVGSQPPLQIQPGLHVDEAGARGEQRTTACIVDRGAVHIEVVGEQDQCVQDIGAVLVAGEAGEERGHVVATDVVPVRWTSARIEVMLPANR